MRLLYNFVLRNANFFRIIFLKDAFVNPTETKTRNSCHKYKIKLFYIARNFEICRANRLVFIFFVRVVDEFYFFSFQYNFHPLF